ncbi:hypothetical protein BST92_13680 [Nonlabens arenilitoris]|uniref:Outer membrane lipoprotein-sorting protein n=1 Tax=Nonlabens arenilitoris TaxID=1217969 RepID=A0A2S7UE46_9FLAO|nr:DUF6503 family protein [Nonlabens arenilitoris]PQJ32907.1 hypothetical protein BST92_13680 [Nonlabens arenilitoris]
MRFFFVLLFLNAFILQAQELSGQQLLDKAIQHHDPDGNWQTFQDYFQVTMTTPRNSDRVSNIEINLPAQRFALVANRDSITTSYVVEKGEVTVLKINEKKPISQLETTIKDEERAVFMKDYYTYLYGLPMKLEDPGTIITDKVERKTFNGKEYLVLEVMYDENVGSDVWYFYFDPTTYKMEIYQFFKRDQKGDIDRTSGEYILLSKNHEVNNINMPKVRNWYYNKDDKFLGTDVITN